MANFHSAVLTAKGIALLAKIQAGTAESVELTKAAAGNGDYEDGESLLDKTSLKSQKQEFPINSVSIVNESTVYVRFVITNQQAVGDLLNGYYIKEVGIFATDPDEGEILYAIATAVRDQWDYLPAYNNLLPSTITMEFYTEVSNASSVTITAGGGAYATLDDLTDLRQEVEGIELIATRVSYDNSGSRMVGENMQDAVDELAADAANARNDLMALQIAVTMLQGAAVVGMSDNVCVDTFRNTSGVSVTRGAYSNADKRLYA